MKFLPAEKIISFRDLKKKQQQQQITMETYRTDTICTRAVEIVMQKHLKQVF